MAESSPDFIDPDECPWMPAAAIFRRLGFTPPPPAAVDDFSLPGRLWELLYAMAARRFFIHSSNHLSDRELYEWLHAEFLPEQTADIPPEAGWNCHCDVSEGGTGLVAGTECWLRYYASERDREDWWFESSEISLPPRETPPYDRDRWLPVPPEGPWPGEGGAEADHFGLESDPEDDPLGLGAVDAEIRAEKRRQARFDAAQTEDWQRPMERLRRAGAAPIPPAELTDETLPAKLWELIHHLACRGFYLHHTDHLGDRELYTALWDRGLREEALLPGKRSRTAAWHHDFVGSGSDEDTQVWLRYYATEEQRARHVRDWPNDPLPPRERPPANRDWRLPQPPC